MRYYTIGEIYRLGLMKSSTGEAYKHKATISKYVSNMKWRKRKTIWGDAKEVAKSEITIFNRTRK